MRGPRRRILILISLVVILLLVIASWPNDHDTILASADKVQITESAFKASYVQWLLATGVPDVPQRRVAYIKDLAATKLLIQDARDNGIETEPHYRDRQERLSRKLLIELYVQKTLLDTIQVTDAETRTAFMQAQTEVTARHLYARTLPEAEALYRELGSGADWDSLARKIFQSPQLQQSGGQLPPFSFDETDPNFEEAAFALPIGSYSKPVRTAQGYSIITVDDRFTSPIITESDYIAKRHLFEAYVRDRKRNSARRDFVLDLLEQADLVFHDETADALLARLIHGAAAESPDHWDQILLEVAVPPMTWTVRDFRDHARFASDRQRAQVQTVADLKEFSRGLVAGAIMHGRARSLDRDPEFQEKLQDALDEYIVAHIRQTLEVAIREDEIQAYYDKAPASEFAWPAEVQLKWQMHATAEQTNHCETVNQVAWLDRTQLGELADEVFAVNEGACLGPYESAQGWVSFQVGPQREPRRQSLTEARGAIEAMLRQQQLREQRTALYDSLAEQHHLNINVDLVSELVLDI